MESLREIRSAGKVVYLTKPESNKELMFCVLGTII